jgi:hypothetical protein
MRPGCPRDRWRSVDAERGAVGLELLECHLCVVIGIGRREQLALARRGARKVHDPVAIPVQHVEDFLPAAGARPGGAA